MAWETINVWAVQAVTAVAILIGGIWVAKLLKGQMQRVMLRHNVEVILVQFISQLVFWSLAVLVGVVALNQVGVEMTAFIAVLGAAGLAIGLALQGTLSNFAAGIMLILLRPFKKGDYIEGGGTAGIVEEVQIFNTLLLTPDKRHVFVPNAQMTGGHITNYSRSETRRVDMTFGVGYDADLKRVREVLTEMVSGDERVLPEPAPLIAVGALGESSVDFLVRPWVKASDYWPLYWDFQERIKLRFDEEGISIPFPQRDVHLYQMDKKTKR